MTYVRCTFLQSCCYLSSHCLSTNSACAKVSRCSFPVRYIIMIRLSIIALADSSFDSNRRIKRDELDRNLYMLFGG